MKKIIFVFTGFLTCALPVFAHAAVQVTEVAWMGTSNSQYEEWIELHNDGTDSVSLSGWKILKSDGATTLFAPTGTIPAGSYYLICRTTASVPSPLGGICNEQGGFGGSGLSNSGEHLQLDDGTGTTVDDLSFASGWPAGDSATKETMQWNGSSWITAVPTPGAATAADSSGGQGGSSDNSSGSNASNNDGANSGSDQTGSSSSGSAGGGPISNSATSPFVSMTEIPVSPDPTSSSFCCRKT
jgi:lamin tail-like protein